MRTYEQYRREILNKFDDGLLQGPVTFGKIEEMAAKEYAKMWVKKVLEETHETYVTATVEDYFNQIDAQ